MAKVTGPLQSLGASGQLAKSMVFFSWKGVAVVRQWLKPANPQSAAQGDVRLVLGGLGRAAGKVEKNSEFHQIMIDLEVIPTAQTKQSYLVDYIRNTFLGGGGATLTANYIAELAELTGHTSYTTFEDAADTLLIAAFDIDYATIDPFDKALGVYLLAKAAIGLSFTGSPYTKTIASWTAAQIDKMVGHMQV